MESELYWNQLKNGTIATAQPNCNGQTLSKMKLPIPPLEEQNRIILKLQKLEPLIQKYQKVEEQLYELNSSIKEHLKKSILQYAIEGKLVPQDPNDEPASILLERIQKEKQKLISEGKIKKNKNESVIYRRDNSYYEKLNELEHCINNEYIFDIPNNWNWCRFNAIVNYRMGKTPPRKNEIYWGTPQYPWISIADMIADGHIEITKEKINQYSADHLFSSISPKGTLIMSFKLTIGRVSILDIDAYHNEAIISIFPFLDKENCLRNYLFLVLPYITQFGNSKKAIKGRTLNSKSLDNLLIPLPPVEEQKRIVNKMGKIIALLK